MFAPGALHRGWLGAWSAACLSAQIFGERQLFPFCKRTDKAGLILAHSETHRFHLVLRYYRGLSFSRIRFLGTRWIGSGRRKRRIGLILNVAGITFLVWAQQRLGRNWSQTVSVKEGHELVTSGLYRWIRHPMYTGGFIACLGSAIVAGGAFVFLLLFLGAIFLWRVGAEDKLMEQKFPNEYPEYKKRTKGVIPFVW
jgi:protein-S-isoprenylcysteine O-methyltransferase Ste14